MQSYNGDVLRFGISYDEALSAYQGQSFQSSPLSHTTKSHHLSNTLEKEETTIPLTEEKLDVTKSVEESQSTITKEPITETKTVEVTVTHEEITIERRQPTGDTSTTQKPVSSREDIEIPLKREEVEVSKTPYVKEDLVIKKKPVTETREVTEEVTSEKVNVANSNA